MHFCQHDAAEAATSLAANVAKWCNLTKLNLVVDPNIADTYKSNWAMISES